MCVATSGGRKREEGARRSKHKTNTQPHAFTAVTLHGIQWFVVFGTHEGLDFVLELVDACKT